MLEQFIRYRTPRARAEWLEKFWQRRFENLEIYLDKLFSLQFDLEGVY